MQLFRPAGGKQSERKVASAAGTEEIFGVELADVVEFVCEFGEAQIDRGGHSQAVLTGVENHLMDLAVPVSVSDHRGVAAHAVNHSGVVRALEFEMKEGAGDEQKQEVRTALIDGEEFGIERFTNGDAASEAIQERRVIALEEILEDGVVTDGALLERLANGLAHANDGNAQRNRLAVGFGRGQTRKRGGEGFARFNFEFLRGRVKLGLKIFLCPWDE